MSKRINHKSHGTNTGNIGALGEILVIHDLMSKGYEMFRAISPCSTCDMVALRDGRLFRVEATKGKRSSKRLNWSHHDPARYDLLAVWEENGSITYSPALEDLR
jgi:hypothetical protein